MNFPVIEKLMSFVLSLFQVKEEILDICVYVYEKKDVETDAKTAQVKYTKNCDTDYVNVCHTKRPKYGYGKPEEYCKEVPQETCHNRPQVKETRRK